MSSLFKNFDLKFNRISISADGEIWGSQLAVPDNFVDNLDFRSPEDVSEPWSPFSSPKRVTVNLDFDLPVPSNDFKYADTDIPVPFVPFEEIVPESSHSFDFVEENNEKEAHEGEPLLNSSLEITLLDYSIICDW